MTFEPSFHYKVIYVFRINDDDHKDLIKIGDASFYSDQDYTCYAPNSKELNKAARDRISDYTKTASINYELLYTEIGVRKFEGNIVAFRDYQVRDVLVRSGLQRHVFDYENQGTEWFEVSLSQAIAAIKAVKEGRSSLTGDEIEDDYNPIYLRDEQKRAIEQTKKTFRTSDKILWNAKMRFGKTLTALELVNELKYHRTIIVTHRPDVVENWFNDFNKIFKGTNYKFCSKTLGEKIETVENSSNPYIYFASMQDLRGSHHVGGDFDKNEFIFTIPWDLLIVDEAHEGTQTDLGQKVLTAIRSNNIYKSPKVIELSGTPFNLIQNYEEGDIYTWDYIMEQQAKEDWAMNHFGDSNPYEELPTMEMYIYNLSKNFPEYIDIEDSAFNFREFFRTWTGDVFKDGTAIPSNVNIGDFVHEKDVLAFLNLLCKSDENNNFPFSTKEYQNYYKHTLWVVPGVKEAKALSALLSKHPIFGNEQFFQIANVAGEGDEEQPFDDALKLVREKIGDNPDNHGSITITCSSGRLTTGVTVPEWTAVFMLAGSCKTSPSSYLQTIFRIQNPANINGKIKEKCTVFDFAPDRTLKMVAEAANLSTKTGNTSDRKNMALFLNYCPVISLDASEMIKYDVESLLQQLKRAYADKAVKNGFDDRHIYNDNLLKLDDIQLEEFERLKAIIGSSKQKTKIEDIPINAQGFTDEEYDKLIKAEKKPKKNLTEEEKALLEEQKKKREDARKAMSILRGISIRIPLMIYGADIPYNQEVTLDNFTSIIDESSWNEFMPEGVTPEVFKQFSKYYERDVFVAAGRKIRQISKAADDLNITDRVKQISELFMSFKNPDKETVLTPWRVVNLHISSCLGGYKFFDDDDHTLLEKPKYIDHGEITRNIFDNPESKILEINSKSGLYPLYMSYSLYMNKIKNLDLDENDLESQWNIWRDVVENCIFVICKTPMAKTITKRTLLGYKDGKLNAHAFDDLIMQVKEKPEQLKAKIMRGSFWNKEGNMIYFDAVVGNPPYQSMIGKTEKQSQGNNEYIYYHFQNLADQLGKYTCLIYPFGGWFDNPSAFDNFGNKLLYDHHTVAINAYEGTTDKRAWFRTDKNPDPIFSDDANLSAGVSVVLRDHTQKQESLYYSNRVYSDEVVEIIDEDIDYICPNPLFIQINKKLGKPKLKDQIKRGMFGIESNFVELNPNKVSFKKEDWKDPILLYTNDKSGSAGRCTKFWTSKENITSGLEYLDYYKVLMISAYPKQKLTSGISTIDNVKRRVNEIVEVLPAGSAFGASRLALFMSKDKHEIDNFMKYINTDFFAGLVLQEPNRRSTFGTIIPSQDYTNLSDIPWSKSIEDIDNKLYEKYNISSEERKFIEQSNR